MHHEVTYFHVSNVQVNEGLISFDGRKESHTAALKRYIINQYAIEEMSQEDCLEHENEENLVVTFLQEPEDEPD